MKFSKSLYLGILAAGLVLSGCNSDKTEEDMLPGGGVNPNDPLASGAWGKSGQGLTGGINDWTPIPGLTFPAVYFAYDQDRLGTSETAKLDQVASYLSQHADVYLIIEGNCDERGSDEYNRALGERRAISVRNYLVGKGIPDARFKTISYGEERPAIQGHDESAWGKNRRAELIGARPNK